jgi:hypothetical protein
MDAAAESQCCWLNVHTQSTCSITASAWWHHAAAAIKLADSFETL